MQSRLWSVNKLEFKKTAALFLFDFKKKWKQLFFSRLTYSMIFLWALTWYAYWIFMKSQTTVLNILGFVLSGILLALSHFVEIEKIIEYKKGSSLSNFFEAKKDTKVHKKTSACSVNVDMPITKNAEKEKPVQPKMTEQTQPSSLPKIEIGVTEKVGKRDENEIALQPSTVVQTHQAEIHEISEKPSPVAPKTNGCPKNLDYYTKRPRPIQMPTECLTCKNLITCVSSANNQ